MSPMDPHRPGMALILAVLVLVALGTVATGLLSISLQHARIARSEEELLRVRVAAESAVRSALARWKTRDYRRLAVGEIARTTDTVGSRRRVTVVERLAGPLYLLWAEVVAPREGPRSRSGVLVRALDIAELWRSFPAAVTLGGTLRVEDGGRVDGFRPGTPPPTGTVEPCPDAALHALAASFGSAGLPPVLRPDPDGDEGSRVAGAGGPAAAGPAAFDFSRIGPLDRAHLEAIADRVATGSLQPRPALDAAACDTDAPGNWGAPLEPGTACADYFPLIFAPGDLHVDGGAGQGVLIVTGDLVVSGGARFDGPVLVGGQLIVRDAGTIFGAATIAADATVRATGRIAADPCTIWRALARAPALNRPFRPGARFWLPAF